MVTTHIGAVVLARGVAGGIELDPDRAERAEARDGSVGSEVLVAVDDRVGLAGNRDQRPVRRVLAVAGCDARPNRMSHVTSAGHLGNGAGHIRR